MSTPTATLPKLLLLDYGGVLLHLNDPLETFGVGDSREDFNRLWLLSPAVQAHETGKIGPAEFGRQIVRDLELPYSAEEFIERFDAWPDRVPEATARLIQSVPRQVACAILSNTNELHWRKQDIARDFGGRIARTYLSFETGLIKPDPRAFSFVLEETRLAAEDVLFIDDNPLNIEAAADKGMRARLCLGVDSLGPVLQEAGLFET